MDESRSFFRRKTAALLAMVAVFLLVNAVSATYVGFDFADAALEVPAGVAWMAAEFIPSVDSLSKLGSIMPALASTVLVSVAASCLAAIGAFVLAAWAAPWRSSCARSRRSSATSRWWPGR